MKNWFYEISFRLARFFGATGLRQPAKPGEDLATWGPLYFTFVGLFGLSKLIDWQPGLATLFRGIFVLAMFVLSARQSGSLLQWPKLEHAERARRLFFLASFMIYGFVVVINFATIREANLWHFAFLVWPLLLLLAALVCSVQALRARRAPLASSNER